MNVYKGSGNMGEIFHDKTEEAPKPAAKTTKKAPAKSAAEQGEELIKSDSPAAMYEFSSAIAN